MDPRNNDQGFTVAVGLAAGLALMGVTWHYVVTDFVPVRYDLWLTARDDLSHWQNFTAYIDATWPSLINAGYPVYFTVAVLPAVLLYGVIVAAQRRSLVSVREAIAGWLIGAGVGYLAMSCLPMPNLLVETLVMPGLALLAGSLAPVLLMPPNGVLPLRGTRIVRHRGSSSRRAVEAAAQVGRTVLAGAMLDPAAEVRHLVVIGVTGAGKSVALLALMYTAIRRGDRHSVADPDGNAMRLFYQAGDVILNPSDARSAKWDILAEIKEHSDYRLLAESVLPFPRDDAGNEWVRYAQEVFATCLETWHTHRLGSSDAFLQVMATADKKKLGALCEDTAAHRYFESGNEKMFGSVMGTLAPALGSMLQLARVPGPSFSVRRWMREGKGSLWIPLPRPADPGAARPDILLDGAGDLGGFVVRRFV